MTANAPARRRTARARATTAHYDVAGPPGAPAIVFVHGIRVTRKQWSPQMRGLSDAFRVVALDLPGHGSRAAERFTLAAASRALEETIEEAAGGRALVAGLSLGGYVAMSLAGRAPHAVAGMVLTGCSGNPHGVLRTIPATVALFSRAVGDRWLSAVNRATFRARFGEDLAREQLDAGLFFAATVDALRQLRGRDFLRALRAYAGPVLILNGEKDSLYRFEELMFLATAPDARLQLVRRAGHVANLERPAAYNRAIRSFARCIDW
jgi:pimeloyl-ACP methyl ester carboxylesterase